MSSVPVRSPSRVPSSLTPTASGPQSCGGKSDAAGEMVGAADDGSRVRGDSDAISESSGPGGSDASALDTGRLVTGGRVGDVLPEPHPPAAIAVANIKAHLRTCIVRRALYAR